MKIFSLIATLACAVAAFAAEEQVTLQDVRTTAASLDTLLSQNKEKVAVFVQGKWHEGSKDPINIASVTPVVARKLQLENSEVSQLLQNDPTKLSQLVMAKLLSEKTGKPWNDIIQGATEESLLQKLQAEQIPLEKVQSALNNIFADVSFAVMDYENRAQAIGTAAGSEKGKAASPKKSKK
jgi:hypothetical protein